MAKRSQLNQAIRHYRLRCAEEIVCNIGQLDTDYAAELCEQYVMRIFLNWLATKYGLPALNIDMQSVGGHALTSLEAGVWPPDTYPLQSLFSTETECALRDFGFALLDKSLPADLHLAGELYQQSIRAPLRVESSRHVSILTLKERSTSAEFYTPPWVVSFCFAQIKHKLVCSNIYDPACGSGNFLLGALSAATAFGADPQTFAATSIYGQDVDPRAVSLCRLLLFLKVAKESSHPPGRKLAEALRANIVVGDSTMSPTTEKFDVVATNPPYISYGSRGQLTIASSQSALLRALYPQSSEYKIRLHSIFQELCLQAAKAEGDVLLLLPDAYLTGSFYKKLRALITAEAEIVQIAELPRDTIREATVGNWCIAHYRKKAKGATGNDKQTNPVIVCEVGSQGSVESSSAVPFDVFVSDDCLRFNIVKNPWDLELIRHLKQFPPLKESLTGHTGIRSRHGQKSIIASSRLTDRHRRGLVSGAQVLPFQSNWQGHWLNLEKKLLFAGGFDPEIVERPKLLMRQTADRIIAAADTQALYHLNNIHTFCPRKPDCLSDLDAWVCVLNSNLFSYIYRLRSRECKRALAQIDIDMVESMPLPTMNGSARSLALAGKALRQPADTPRRCRENIMRAVDRVVYDLYEVPEEIVLHIDGMDLPTSSQARELIQSLETNTMPYYSIKVES